MSNIGRDHAETAEKKTDDPGRINALQIAAATGATTTAAVVANALGISGTVTGVAVISVISSVGSVVYLRSMRHTKEKLDKVVRNRDTLVLRSRTGSVEATVVPAASPKDEDAAAPTEPLTRATGTAKVPAVVIPDDETPSVVDRGKHFLRRNWRSIAVSSLAVFVLTVGMLTSLAMLSGKPATSYYDSRPDHSTSSDDEPAPSDGEQSSDESGDEETPSDGGSTIPETEEPSSPQTTTGEPEPSTQDSSPEDEGDGDGGLKPTPSGGGDAASRR